MGKVFLAVDREAEQTNPFVALKILGDRFREHPQAVKALRREANEARRLSHPNIVNVYDFDRTEDHVHVFMVMEYMKGSALDDWLTQHPGSRRLHEVWHIVEACGHGLHYLHERQIIHSDFKPGNVFLTEEGEIKVLDLGIARIIDETQLAGGTTRFDPDTFGALTPQYASCEMFEGLTPNAQDDLYALACVTYELLTGEHPYERRMAVEARSADMKPRRPRGLRGRQWKTLRSALAFSRRDRPQSVVEFLEGLAPTRSRGSPLPWIAATVGVVVLAAVVVTLQMRSPDDRFVEALLEQYAESPARPATRAKADEWLRQGDFFLELGRRSMEAGDYDQGASQLLTGPSSAYQSYRLALTRSDSEDAKMRAVDGMLGISHAFRNAVERMAARSEDPVAMARIACHGLSVNRLDGSLERRLVELNQRLPKGIGSVNVCRELVNSGTVAL